MFLYISTSEISIAIGEQRQLLSLHAGLQPSPTHHDRPMTAALMGCGCELTQTYLGLAAAQQSEPCDQRAELAAIGLAF
jgi:hypothetical protein